jgi:hypothetical protein
MTASLDRMEWLRRFGRMANCEAVSRARIHVGVFFDVHICQLELGGRPTFLPVIPG